MNLLVTDKVSAGLVVSRDNLIEGIFTSRDILRFLGKETSNTNKSTQDLLNNTTVETIMTPRGNIYINIKLNNNILLLLFLDRLVYCSSDDTVNKCREIMFKV